MNLDRIYQPIAEDIEAVESFLQVCLLDSQSLDIQSLGGLLLESSGKRMRPALVILSERAASAGNGSTCDSQGLIRLATSLELIHLASLIHDDVLDGATMRRNKPSINARMGDNISIVFGDYIYSKAFELIGKCRNHDIFESICNTVYLMSEGELIHICRRGNLELSKDSYLDIIIKKTASLFAAGCHVGTIYGNHSNTVRQALKKFGMNFGIAFQIIDDCRDIISEKKVLGKHPGQDIVSGDMTLPLLNLFDAAGEKEKCKIVNIFKSKVNEDDLRFLKQIFVESGAFDKTRETIFAYLEEANITLNILENSQYKKSLQNMTESISEEMFNLIS